MASPGTAFLMYHELSLPGKSTCRPEPGYTRYVVTASDFRSHMTRLAEEGWHGRSVSQALESFGSKSVCVTFDDGCETDLLMAAPLLKELGFGATSYITVEFLNKSGYMSHAQVRELHALGFEIGCHSMTHPHLTDVNEKQLNAETAEAKDRLQQIAGVRVDHFSCPGGRWNTRVARAVKSAGFRTMATSVTGLNSPTTDLFALNRIPVMDGASTDQILRACQGKGLVLTRLMERTRAAARSIIGNQLYDSVRRMILGVGKKSDSPAN